jgi:hypothetical protein
LDDIVDFERTLQHTASLEAKLLMHDDYYQKRLLDLMDQTHAVGKLRKENLKQLEVCRRKKAEQEAFIRQARETVHKQLCEMGGDKAVVGGDMGARIREMAAVGAKAAGNRGEVASNGKVTKRRKRLQKMRGSIGEEGAGSQVGEEYTLICIDDEPPTFAQRSPNANKMATRSS